MKLFSRKGFTLAELLIVMAIIVVLASVAIPSFTRQLETSRETADIETLRNAYTEAYTEALQDLSADGKLGSGGTSSEITKPVKLVQTKAGFQYATGKIAGADVSKTTFNGVVSSKTSVKFTLSVAADTVSADTTTGMPGAAKGDLYLSAIAFS